VQNQQRVRHLLRRFGLGAAPKEVRELELLSQDDAFARLLDYNQRTDPYQVSPWEFTVNDQNPQINTNARNFADWWALKMCVTNRPLEEKLTLFWHDHFAVSESKVQDGRKMLQYLATLRKHASGNFAEMLWAVSKDPAMIVWLDIRENVRGRPNENFAREVMELFTLGVDNGYTEQDIAEAARALTGWAFRDTLNYRERETNPIENQIKEKVRNDQPMFEFQYVANRHETGEKTILGKTGDFTGDDVVRILLDHPNTPRLICTKLWEWFAYPKPEAEIVDKLASTFVQKGYEIKPVLREIASHPAFWSDKCVGKKVKSPVDYTVGLARQFGAVAHMQNRAVDQTDPFRPIHNQARQLSRAVNQQVRRQGLELLYPPSVEGWHWNEEWIGPEGMLYRIDLARQFFANRNLVAPMLEWITPEIAVEPSSTADAQTVDRILMLMDVEVDAEQRAVLAQHARQIQLNTALYSQPRNSVDRLWRFLQVVFAVPQTHLH
jgi:uncharacterized protein (DUF1800 family)